MTRAVGLERASRRAPWLACCIALLCGTSTVAAQGASDLAIGHWVEVKGKFQQGQFFAEEVEVVEPETEESIIGDVSRVADDGSSFVILGQRVSISERTRWRGVSLETLMGARVRVEGHYRGPRKLSSRSITLRDSGRERISGRVDNKRRIDFVTELNVMNFSVILARGLGVEHEDPLDSYALAPAQGAASALRTPVRPRDDDKDIPVTALLTDELSLGLRLDWAGRHEEDFNLDKDDEEDRTDSRFGVRGELIWVPGERFYGLVGFRFQKLSREDEDDGHSAPDDFRLREAYGYVRDVGLEGLDLQAGRQNFDEEREWVYDDLLDAVRLHYTRPSWKLELSASTFLADGSPRNEGTDNFMAYLSNTNEDRHLAAYVVDRRDERGVQDYPIHFGARALGDWIPANKIWLEGSILQGYTGDTDLRGYGFDVGTTWSPRFLGPFYLNVGYAFGSGDADPGDGDDGNFRQTGLQDNTDKLGGVTSFKYYGELIDPELSNMGIATLGIGARLGRRNSLDLVYHQYRQAEAASFLLDTDIDRRPTGLDPDLGWEVDLIFGSRAYKKVDVEIVLAAFEPGSAFTARDTAYLAKVQVRLKL